MKENTVRFACLKIHHVMGKKQLNHNHERNNKKTILESNESKEQDFLQDAERIRRISFSTNS
jgi:hypothetical protein